MLTSTTAEAKTISSELALHALLNIVSVVNVSYPSALFVCSNVVKDVAADTTMNKVANHVSIATVVEEIVHENENKVLEFDVIADMVEDSVNEAVGQSDVENNDMHTAGEEIVATADEMW